jgi:hypothetical protein
MQSIVFNEKLHFIVGQSRLRGYLQAYEQKTGKLMFKKGMMINSFVIYNN